MLWKIVALAISHKKAEVCVPIAAPANRIPISRALPSTGRTDFKVFGVIEKLQQSVRPSG